MAENRSTSSQYRVNIGSISYPTQLIYTAYISRDFELFFLILFAYVQNLLYLCRRLAAKAEK